MTQQMPDWVFYEGLRFSLEWDSTGKLPLLSELGVHPLFIGTATRRGYIAEYEITDEQLFLIRLVVGDIQYLNSFAPISTVEPVVEYNYIVDGKPTTDIGDVVYYLKYPMSITGIITIMCRGIDDRHLPHREQIGEPLLGQTLKLKLVSGQISKIKDITSEVIAIQKAMIHNRMAAIDKFKRGEISTVDPKFHDNDELKVLKLKYQSLIQEELE